MLPFSSGWRHRNWVEIFEFLISGFLTFSPQFSYNKMLWPRRWSAPNWDFYGQIPSAVAVRIDIPNLSALKKWAIFWVFWSRSQYLHGGRRVHESPRKSYEQVGQGWQHFVIRICQEPPLIRKPAYPPHHIWKGEEPRACVVGSLWKWNFLPFAAALIFFFFFFFFHIFSPAVFFRRCKPIWHLHNTKLERVLNFLL